MAVLVTFRVDVRPYTAYDDPSLPIAAWVAQGGVAGDASGGFVIMTFQFQSDDNPQISELFNLEMISMDTSASAAIQAMFETVAMDTLAPNRPGSSQRWHMNTVATSVGTSALSMEESNILPLWLGSPSRVEGLGGLRITTPNVDLLLYAVTLQGYIWGPRSVLAQGGPRRPVGGLFGKG